MAGSRGRAGFAWPWGDALPVLEDAAPDVRVINLETSITRSRDFAPGKAIHYRMSPGNVPCLAAARPDACALANNLPPKITNGAPQPDLTPAHYL